MNTTIKELEDKLNLGKTDLKSHRCLLKPQLNCFFLYLLFMCLFLPVLSIGQERPSLSKNNAELHPLIQQGPLTNPYESLVLGNGDVAISAQVFSHLLLLKIGKNNVWDSRSEFKTEDNLLTQDKLIEVNGAADNLFDFNMAHSPILSGKPSPKPVGLIKISHAGLSNTKVLSKVNIATGVLTVEYEFPEGQLVIEVFVHKEKNSIISKITAHGDVPWISIAIEKQPDYVDSEIPDPVITQGVNNKWAISQTINKKYGIPTFSWHMSCLFPEELESAQVPRFFKWRYAVEQYFTLQDGASISLSVGVACDRDGVGNSLNEAFKLADVSDLDQYEEEKLSHLKAWESFWAACSIDLEDKELEALWYRTLFGFACHLTPNAQAPGLNANIPIYDYSAWNGDYHWNHNVEKWYFPALPLNHPEWYDVLANLVNQHIPIFEHYAKLIFNLDGAYVDLYTFPFIPPERAKTYATFGRALALTGWISQMLFQHYEFTNNSDWLMNNAYEFLSKAAEFYANYLDKYQGDDNIIFPSMLLEDSGGWKEGFPENRNVVTDLVMFRKAFESAIEASIVLDVDANKRERWSQKLTRIPEVEYGWTDGQGWYGIYKDWQKVWPDFNEYIDHLRTSRWGCSGWLVFPGEYIEGDEEEGLTLAVRDVLSGTDLLNLPDRTRQIGTFHGEANFLPFIRMGIMEKYDDLRTLLLNHRYNSGQFSPFSTGENIYVRSPSYVSWRVVENQYFPILGIAEMLLQSQGNVIRLFPYWPLQKSASFNNMRARDGFIVSATWNPDSGMLAKITSTNGNNCRIRWEKEELPVILYNGNKIDFTKEGRDIVFTTLPHSNYELRYYNN